MEIVFTGKRALVTGAGKGIGRAIALALARGGAETYVISRTQADLDTLKEEHQNIRPICQDITDLENTRKTLADIGCIDLLVNNAAVIRTMPFLDSTSDVYDFIMNTNVKATINISQIVAKSMIERKSGGAIVNISSQVSQRAIDGYSLYSASKAALDSITKSMAVELGSHQVRVNAVNPTYTLTESSKLVPPEIAEQLIANIPQKKAPEEADVVHAVLYLLSDKSDLINGAILPVDGGCWAK